MKERRKGIKSLILCMMFLFILPFSSNAIERVGDDYAPNEVIIGFQADATESEIQSVVTSIGGTIIGRINLPNAKIVRVKLSSNEMSSVQSAINTVREKREGVVIYNKVTSIAPNYIIRAHGSSNPGILSQSNDPLLTDQWGYYDIGADLAINFKGLLPVIAVIDTGVDYNHPDLKGKIIKGYDFVNMDNDPMDDNGHGTHVAGIIGAISNNNYGIAGVAWQAKILAIKVLNFEGWGYLYDIVSGIIYAANNPYVKVINMSLGGPYSYTEEIFVEYAVNIKKKLIVAAAGNENTNTPSYPAGFSTYFPNKVIAVAAHGDNHCRASFSNYGTWVSITAPGVSILSTIPTQMGEFNALNGTSMAAPFVSAASALAWAKYPSYTNSQIGNLIITRNASLYDPLERDDTCWPDDGSTFERLSLLHILDYQNFENCDNISLFYGYAVNGETGDPLAGAKVFTMRGTTITGENYVPWYGYVTNPYYNDYLGPFYGLFEIFVSPAGVNHNLTIKKQRYATLKINDILANNCDGVFTGVLPVPPNKPYYWLEITWTSDDDYDAYLKLPNNEYIYHDNPGILSISPWARYMWDSYYYSDLRKYSESIRIRKLMSGIYKFFVDDWWNGSGSTSWSLSGIKAYIYRWDPATLTQKLIKIITPPTGSAGEFWYIADIKGSTITVVNTVSDIYP